MDYGQILKTIQDSKPLDDWRTKHRGKTEVRFYVRDVNIRFETTCHDSDVHADPFVADWATRYPDSRARSYYYNLYYSATLIARFVLVAVDNARASLPVPDFVTKKIAPLDYKDAQIFDALGTLDEYMERSGLIAP